MLVYPKLNPVAINFGIFKVYWYGIMYLMAFLFFVYAGKWRLKKYGHSFLTKKLIDDFMFYGALGVIVGGRLGYCFFYEPIKYLTHPLDILKTWTGGMSFHGGMLGVFIAIYFFAKSKKHGFFELSDFVAPLIPMGLFFGRIGNFINGELIGRVTTINLPWAMIYPQSGSMLPRHPSEIYEALGEGLLLLLLLWIYASKPRKVGQVSGFFLIAYGMIRFCLEYFREPDYFLRDVVEKTGLSMGQWYCVPMMVAGGIIFYLATKNKFFTKLDKSK